MSTALHMTTTLLARLLANGYLPLGKVGAEEISSYENGGLNFELKVRFCNYVSDLYKYCVEDFSFIFSLIGFRFTRRKAVLSSKSRHIPHTLPTYVLNCIVYKIE